MSKMSVCVPFNSAETLPFPSPLIVFTEKVFFCCFFNFFKLRTSVISCKQMSVISPIQLLLFGSRKVEALGNNMVRLDDMLVFLMGSF